MCLFVCVPESFSPLFGLVRSCSDPFHLPSTNVAAWLNIKSSEMVTLFNLLLNKKGIFVFIYT